MKNVSRVYAPLEVDHPLVKDQEVCWICGRSFQKWERPCLVACDPPPENGYATVEARPAHATCAYRGEVVRLQDGSTVVIDRIRDGDGSPYPVVTTDGRQWTLEEVGLEGRDGT